VAFDVKTARVDHAAFAVSLVNFLSSSAGRQFVTDSADEVLEASGPNEVIIRLYVYTS
jgi:hypothetical protein